MKIYLPTIRSQLSISLSSTVPFTSIEKRTLLGGNKRKKGESVLSRPIRQGDILLTLISDKNVKRDVSTFGSKVKRKRGLGLVVAEGEATGHHHVVRTKGAELIERKGALYLKVPKTGAELTHDEHETLKVKPGMHRVTRNQREYEPPPAPYQAPRSVRVYD